VALTLTNMVITIISWLFIIVVLYQLCVSMSRGARGAVNVWLPGAYAQMNSPQNEEMTNASLAYYASDLSAQGIALWEDEVVWMADVNTALQYVVGNISLFYNDTAVVHALNATTCTVQSPYMYYTNYTPVHEFGCCHVRKLKTPALLKLHADLYTLYLGAASVPSIGSDDVLDVLVNLIRDAETARLSYESGACKDDVSIHIPETVWLLLDGSTKRIAWLLHLYNNLSVSLSSLSTCVLPPILGNADAIGCLYTSPISSAQINVNLNFTFSDMAVQAVCSNSAIASLESARLAQLVC